MEISLAELAHVCGVVGVSRLQALLPHLNAALAIGEITTPARAGVFLGNILEETVNLSAFEENLNYSHADRIAAVFRSHFRDAASAAPFVHNPEALGNFVYAGRNGNGDVASGDGFRYRGRGAPMLTGVANYRRLEVETGLPVTSQPDLVAQPRYAFLAAAKFSIWRGLNAFADKQPPDLAGARRAWNGTVLGLADVEARFRSYMELVAPQT